MSRRPGFRTRVYASNLGMVENNYKEALARLERSRRPASADREQTSMHRASPLASKPLFDFNGDEFDEDLSIARARASKVIHEKSIIDSRSDQLRSHSLAPVSSSVLENDFDEQVRLRRFLLRRSDVNRDNSVIYVIPLPSDSHYIPRSYYDYYNYYNYYNSSGCGCGCS
ncbi:AAEL014456-PA [Aedes aegypti]|uniref:AAEL014456-PA n=1 Tax=Aedes aegypti TaxID=7159 RepID=Q16G96_AEDAE|nr:AAEL014456-PA [Aedes aegypti]